MDKNLYDILHLDKHCSMDDIKSSYRTLAFKYHPDICTLPNAHELFIDVNEAYNILHDVNKRKMYDSLSRSQKTEFYYDLKKYVSSHVPDIDRYIKFFFDNENVLKCYVNDMNLCAIYNHMLEKMHHVDITELIQPLPYNKMPK
jgi:DnaJ-class molecular chaperone